MEPKAASGKVTVGSRSARTRHTAMIMRAKPTEPTISNVVPLCGAAPLNQAESHWPGRSAPSQGPSEIRPPPHQCVVTKPAP
jgi:hypothetical protein